MKTYLSIIFFIIIWSAPLIGEVKAPNYDFSLDVLKFFYPGSDFDAAKEKFGNGVIQERKGNLFVIRYNVTHQQYKFPVFVQVFNKKIIDFYAKLPSYFLHDVFHQSLINLLGNQDSYHKQENNAVYIWKNKLGFKHIYSGSCTITCFPIYYTGVNLSPPEGMSYESLIDKFTIKNPISK